MDAEKPKELTGFGNDLILRNLIRVAEYLRGMRDEKNRKASLWIRTPLIPGDTALKENIMRIGRFVAGRVLDVTERWELCAFNAACAAKYARMQLPWPYEGVAPMKKGETDELKKAALSCGIPDDKIIVTGIVTR
jgi:pyruvate formate lyase activating enzyme